MQKRTFNILRFVAHFPRAIFKFGTPILASTFILNSPQVLGHDKNNQNLSSASPSSEYTSEQTVIYSKGTEYLVKDGVGFFKVLLGENNFRENSIEIAEMTLNPGFKSRSHTHKSAEFFYVLSGELHQEVNGKKSVLKAGHLGIVPANANVIHSVPSETPLKALAIWAPGGELNRLKNIFETQATEEPEPQR